MSEIWAIFFPYMFEIYYIDAWLTMLTEIVVWICFFISRVKDVVIQFYLEKINQFSVLAVVFASNKFRHSNPDILDRF